MTYLSYDDLLANARAAIGDRTHAEVAADLGVSRPAISQALKHPGGGFARRQREIIARYSPYQVDSEPVFRLRRSTPAPSQAQRAA